MRLRNLLFLAIALPAAVGVLAAYSIASEPIAYIASMFFGVYLYMMAAVALVLSISGTLLATIGKQRKYGCALILSSMMLLGSYIGGFQLMKALGCVVSEANGSNDMVPIPAVSPR